MGSVKTLPLPNLSLTYLIISNPGAKYVLPSVAAPGAGGTIAINHALGEEDVMVTVRETGAAGAGFYAGVDYTLTFTDGNNLVITDIGGALGAGTLRVSVMG